MYLMYKIFLYIHKAYDMIYWGQCLKILEGCGVIPRYPRLIQKYWDLLLMVLILSGYYNNPFKGLSHPRISTLSRAIQYFCGHGCQALSENSIG